ncbi:MAG: peptide-methionine (S)-S-oxide reductase MsrA [Myxococcales bacterium]|nr:MAG: peptide-methionine (S)-S-oxide reductase MsrA [Myxococcales bacterium]
MFRFIQVALLFVFACHAQSHAEDKAISKQPSKQQSAYAEATFAGGCFWCMEKPFDMLPGVIATIAGYTGGHTKNPSYNEVSSGNTGHAEAVRVRYDPKRTSYKKLLDVFWHNIDPTVKDRQFCDVGKQYRSAIFYHDAKQKKLAESSKLAIEKAKHFKTPLKTLIRKAGPFYPAEDYHQDFYKTHPETYRNYSLSCGREKALQRLWSEP